jgi:hypothetical protein
MLTSRYYDNLVSILGSEQLGIFPSVAYASYFLRFCTVKSKVIAAETFRKKKGVLCTIAYLGHKRFYQQSLTVLRPIVTYDDYFLIKQIQLYRNLIEGIRLGSPDMFGHAWNVGPGSFSFGGDTSNYIADENEKKFLASSGFQLESRHDDNLSLMFLNANGCKWRRNCLNLTARLVLVSSHFTI